MTARPFAYESKDYLDRLNDLYNSGMPRVLSNPSDPASSPTQISTNRTLVFDDNGCVGDVVASATLTLGLDCLQDGWSMFINVITGTATINSATAAGTTFNGGASTKTIAAGNAALISSDGVNFRIFRFTAV